jgi:hypothetical protein
MQKHPVDQNNFKRFRLWLLEMVEMYGVASSKEVNRQVSLLTEALDRHIFESTNPKKVSVTPSRKFIAIFNSLYRILTDYDYKKVVSSVEVKNIESFLSKLNEVGVSSDEYLNWFFNVFLPDNQKLCPPTISMSCSNFIWTKFLFEHKDELKKREKQAILLTAERDLYRRAKELLEKTSDEKISIWTKQYRSGAITMDQWREYLSEFENNLPSDGEKE